MTVEVHAYIVDVQVLRTSMLKIILWMSDKSSMHRDYELFLPVVRSIACSSYLCRDANISARQLACHHVYLRKLPLEGLPASAKARKVRICFV